MHPMSLFSALSSRLRRSSRDAATTPVRARRALKPAVTDSTLEERKLLSTFTVNNGAYSVRVWTHDYSSSDRDIRARITKNGRVVRDNIIVANSTRYEDAPSVSLNANGRFVVSWEDRLGSSNTDVKIRVFGPNGSPFTSAMTVNNSTKREYDAEVAINSAGRIVVAYTQQYSSSDLDVRAREYYPTNSAGTSYRTTDVAIATESNRNEFDPEVLVNSNGNWAVSYTRRYGSSDLDARAYVRRTNGSSSTYTVANTTGNEDSTIVESYSGSTLKVSYRKGSSRYSRTLTV
jgi:hypothetical protein